MANHSLHYAYDNFHQLTSDGRTGNLSYSTRTFTYDLAANRASYNGTNWTNNKANQLTSAPTWSETYTFDRKGNTATKVVGGTTTTYGYDFEQRPVQRRVAPPGNGGVRGGWRA